ncbi:MAG: diacylglycerol kinase [Paracoccaceae bacterium]|jgi:diacylglycerol kinase (ATP)
MTDNQRPDPPPGGPAHVLAAARYSLGGLARVWQETAFRHQLLAAALLLPVYVAAHARPFEIVLFVLLALIGFAFEAINTAIEELVDRVSPERSEMAKNAKDLGSLAVAFVLIAHGVLLAFVLIA